MPQKSLIKFPVISHCRVFLLPYLDGSSTGEERCVLYFNHNPFETTFLLRHGVEQSFDITQKLSKSQNVY